jgi:hypothetical protein
VDPPAHAFIRSITLPRLMFPEDHWLIAETTSLKDASSQGGLFPGIAQEACVVDVVVSMTIVDVLVEVLVDVVDVDVLVVDVVVVVVVTELFRVYESYMLPETSLTRIGVPGSVCAMCV